MLSRNNRSFVQELTFPSPEKPGVVKPLSLSCFRKTYGGLLEVIPERIPCALDELSLPPAVDGAAPLTSGDEYEDWVTEIGVAEFCAGPSASSGSSSASQASPSDGRSAPRSLASFAYQSQMSESDSSEADVPLSAALVGRLGGDDDEIPGAEDLDDTESEDQAEGTSEDEEDSEGRGGQAHLLTDLEDDEELEEKSEEAVSSRSGGSENGEANENNQESTCKGLGMGPKLESQITRLGMAGKKRKQPMLWGIQNPQERKARAKRRRKNIERMQKEIEEIEFESFMIEQETAMLEVKATKLEFTHRSMIDECENVDNELTGMRAELEMDASERRQWKMLQLAKKRAKENQNSLTSRRRGLHSELKKRCQLMNDTKVHLQALQSERQELMWKLQPWDDLDSTVWNANSQKPSPF